MKAVLSWLMIGCATALLFQCSQSSTTSSEQDSIASNADSLETEHLISTPNASFSFEVTSDDADDETLFDAFQKSFLEQHASEDSVVFESHEFYRGNFLSQGQCVERSILEVRVSNPTSGNLLVRWYVIEEANPRMYAVYYPIEEDITEYQDETSADMSMENHLSECPVVTVTYKTEGGDIDFHSQETITFYSVDSGGFNEILQIELDNTTDREGYVEGDTTKAEFEKREFTILKNKTNNLFDIQVDYDNGSEKTTEVFAWNGTKYSLKLD